MAETIELTWSEQRRREGWEQGVAEGRQQGVAEGLVQGEVRALTRLLRVRFGQLPGDLETRLAEMDATALDRLADRVLQTRSLDEFLAAL